MKGYFVALLAIACIIALAECKKKPKATSQGSGKVQTGKKNKANIKMSTNANGKNVKTSSSMKATSSKNKGSTKGKASTSVKGGRKKRFTDGLDDIYVDDSVSVRDP
ncbi:hypothetical protein O3M35_013098 [Rhynocoris fuscipes]|uniref:Uncharacterized protein n=1 Tax=Rhynocoris fuscipes TaxID=488301 RepID=A0AAW1CH54_9HEMI